MNQVRKLPNPTDFDLRLLRVFEAVVKAGSFTAAELTLNKSKSSISMDISALEMRLGVKLCRRGRSGFALTSQGKEVYALVVELFRNLHEFRDGVGQITSRVSGELGIVIDDNFPFSVHHELAEALRAFNCANSDVFLTIRTTSPEHVVQLILDGSAEIGICALPRSVPEVEAHPLFDEVMVLCCGARHPLFKRPDSQISMKEISGFDCVDVVARQNARVAKVIDQMRVRARAGTINARVLFILSGNFIGFLPLDFARIWIERGEMRAMLVNELAYKNACYAIVRRSGGSNVARDMLLEKLKRVFAPRRTISPIIQPEFEKGRPAEDCTGGRKGKLRPLAGRHLRSLALGGKVPSKD